MQQIDQENSLKVLETVINLLTKGLVIVLPLFFLSTGTVGLWTATYLGMDDFNKQYLLWLIVPLVVFLWILKCYQQGKLNFKRTPLDIPIIIFLGTVGLATIFSLDSFSSLFGYYGRINQPYLGLVSLVLWYFFIVNFISKKETIINLVKLTIFSYGVIILATTLISFEWWSSLLRDNRILSVFINLAAGSLEDLSIFMAVIGVLLIGLLVNKKFYKLIFTNKWQIWLAWILLLLSGRLLIIINFIPAWWCLLTGVLFIIIINHYFNKKIKLKYEDVDNNKKTNRVSFRLKRILWLLILILLPLGFLLNSYLAEVNSATSNRLVQKLQLDYNNTLYIAGQVLKERPILGYGPEAFAYTFSLFRNPQLNNAEFWALRFNKSASYMSELLITTGILGFLSYLLIIVLLLYFISRFLNYFLKEDSENLDSKQIKIFILASSLLAAIFSLLVGQFLYSVNTVLLFLFWLLMALFMAGCCLLVEARKKKLSGLIFKTLDFRQQTKSSYFKLVILVIFLLFFSWLVLASLEVKYWLAQVYYKDGSGQEQELIKAVRLNPHRYNYQINLAKFYLNKVREELAKPEAKKDLGFIQDNINKSIDSAKRATETASYSVVAYETLGMVYQNISSYSGGSSIFAITAFQEASKLEPSNPVLVTELGKAYLNNGQAEKAIDSFQKAIELKNDYYEAQFSLARVYSWQEKNDEALAILGELTGKYNDVAIYYEQGRIYFNQRKFEPAINKFKQVISISPDHANALYSLGLALEEIGEKEEALSYFKKVLELNPGNIEVKERIEALEEESSRS